VQGIIRGHGGTIDIVSASGQGSRFEILLRARASRHGTRADAAVQASSGGAGSAAATILVIEDEDPLRVAVSKMLRMEGFFYDRGSRRSTGVDLFRANAINIDVVLLDVTLLDCPAGGVERGTADSARRQSRLRLRTARTARWPRLAGKQPWLYIRKPYQLRQLADMLRKRLPAANRRAVVRQTDGWYAFARPKSSTSIAPSGVTMIFAGFKSRSPSADALRFLATLPHRKIWAIGVLRQIGEEP